MSPAARLPLLFLGMLALGVGVLAGLARLIGPSPLPLPEIALEHAGQHGALMIPAFLATVISLERAVALGQHGRWPYLAPLCAGLGGLALITALPSQLAQLLGLLGSALLVGGSLLILRQQTALHTATLALGALAWLIGSLVWWLDGQPGTATPWWMAFLILTIAGERLELTRFLPTPAAARHTFVLIVAALLLGLILTRTPFRYGLTLFSFTLIALAAWLLRYDIARRTLHQQGLPRFIAACLLGGYFWLAAAGLMGLPGGFDAAAAGSPLRDAALHAVFLGFVFSMIFGHAPIIFPAVARIQIPYHPLFYLPLAALHTTLALRVTGDLTMLATDASPWSQTLRSWGGLGNALTLVLFILILLSQVLRSNKLSFTSLTSLPPKRPD
jgi:hypothetical protein